MSTTMRPPGRTERGSTDAPPRRGLLARVSLGDAFAAAPVEFLLIASTALILTGFGMVMVLSATSATSISAGGSPYDAAIRHGVFAAVGVPLMFIVSRLPLRFLKKIAWLALIGGVVLQLLVFTPLGWEFQGNRNWIRIAGYTLQPSEFLKLALALWLGFILYRKRTLLASWSHVFIPLVPVSALVIGTVLAGEDLGTAMILVLIVLGALFFSGVRLRIFILPLVAAVVAVAALAVTSPNRMTRILSFLDTECADYYDTCYQPLHGIWALAEGGVFGLGLGNSKQKYEWLPEAQNDYIFAIVGEELGLIGCTVVLGLFALFAFGAFRIIRRTDDPFVRVVAGAVTIWIVGQAIINIGVVLRVLPVLGVPLPFLSAGGTSLLSVLMATGVLLALARTLPTVAETMAPAPVARPARGRR